tara:strand:+ start:7099 stop:7407 length:309 start_codon:yes stop_codon:yes gene_type:complete
MNLPPSAIVYDDGNTIYIRQDRDRAAFLHLKEQSGRVAFLSAQLELITTSMRDNLDRLDTNTHVECLFELANAARQIGRELHSEFVDYRNHWRNEGDTIDGN